MLKLLIALLVLTFGPIVQAADRPVFDPADSFESGVTSADVQVVFGFDGVTVIYDLEMSISSTAEGFLLEFEFGQLDIHNGYYVVRVENDTQKIFLQDSEITAVQNADLQQEDELIRTVLNDTGVISSLIAPGGVHFDKSWGTMETRGLDAGWEVHIQRMSRATEEAEFEFDARFMQYMEFERQRQYSQVAQLLTNWFVQWTESEQQRQLKLTDGLDMIEQSPIMAFGDEPDYKLVSTGSETKVLSDNGYTVDMQYRVANEIEFAVSGGAFSWEETSALLITRKEVLAKFEKETERPLRVSVEEATAVIIGDMYGYDSFGTSTQEVIFNWH